MKKTWIKIKRGLLRPEHRENLGIKVWLYMYMLDRVDWETGTIFGWKDKDEAEDIGMPWRTLQKQRQEIEELGYITCIKQQYAQDIVVHKWTNPREYTGEEYNVNDETTQTSVHSEDKEIQSTPQSTHQVVSKVGTPTYDSQITNHINKEELKKVGSAGFYIFNLVGYDYKDADIKDRNEIDTLINQHGEYKLCHMAEDYVTETPGIKLRPLLKKIAKDAPFYDMPEKVVEGEIGF